MGPDGVEGGKGGVSESLKLKKREELGYSIPE